MDDLEKNIHDIGKKINRIRFLHILVSTSFLISETVLIAYGFLHDIIPLKDILVWFIIFDAQIYFTAVAATIFICSASPSVAHKMFYRDVQNIYDIIDVLASVAFMWLYEGPDNFFLKIVWVVISVIIVELVTGFLIMAILNVKELFSIIDRAKDVLKHATLEAEFCSVYNESAEKYHKMNAQAQYIGNRLHKKYPASTMICPLKLSTSKPILAKENIHLFWCKNAYSFDSAAKDYCDKVDRIVKSHSELLKLLCNGNSKGMMMEEIRRMLDNADRFAQYPVLSNRFSENAEKLFELMRKHSEEEKDIRKKVRSCNYEQ